MKITIHNNLTYVKEPTPYFCKEIARILVYTDKAAQYQVKRLSKTVWGKASKAYQEAQSKIYQKLYYQSTTESDTWYFPTPCLDLLKHLLNQAEILDLRTGTGQDIALPWVTKLFVLRDYQEEAVDLMVNNWRGTINLATGLGKSAVAIHAIRSMHKKTLFISPNSSIAKQFYDLLCKAFGSHRIGYFGGGKAQIKDITVGIAASVCNHVDQFKNIGLGAIVIDECFPYDEYIATENGPIKIGRLVKNWEEGIPNPKVKSWNEHKKIFEYKNITYAWRKINPNLVTVKYSKRRLHCTPNHKLLTNKGWKCAEDLSPGDLLVGTAGTKSERHVLNAFNDDQMDFLIGSFLGDGNVSKVGKGRYRLSFTHGMLQKDYVEWKAWMLNRTIKIIGKNGYSGKSAVILNSKSFDLEYDIPNNKTYCPKWVIDKINAKSLAVWFMDDGSINQKGNSATIATCSFDEESVEALTEKLKSMGIQCRACFIRYTGRRAPGYWHIKIDAVGVTALKRIIAPYIHTSMLYKINNDERDSVYQWNNKFEDYGYGLVESVTPYVIKMAKGCKPFVFDIEVENNHNFVVCRCDDMSGIIAHNCHHTPCETIVKITDELGHVGKIFGLTATDFRTDGKDILITSSCGPTIIRRDAKWGIANGWLAAPTFFILHVPTTGKDYTDDKLKNYKTHVLNSKEMKSQIHNDAKLCLENGRSTLILVDEVAHGLELSKQLNIKLATGKDKASQSYIEDFNNGKTKGLVGTKAMISEGVDTKNVEVLILATFSASKGNVLQSVGRALRKTETKSKVLIMDYVPLGSTQMRRHANQRVGYYRELTSEVYLRLGGKQITKDF